MLQHERYKATQCTQRNLWSFKQHALACVGKWVLGYSNYSKKINTKYYLPHGEQAGNALINARKCDLQVAYTNTRSYTKRTSKPHVHHTIARARGKLFCSRYFGRNNGNTLLSCCIHVPQRTTPKVHEHSTHKQYCLPEVSTMYLMRKYCHQMYSCMMLRLGSTSSKIR